jgi:hypothetical protein
MRQLRSRGELMGRHPARSSMRKSHFFYPARPGPQPSIRDWRRPRAFSLQLSASEHRLDFGRIASQKSFASCKEVADKESTLVRGLRPEREPLRGRSGQPSALRRRDNSKNCIDNFLSILLHKAPIAHGGLCLDHGTRGKNAIIPAQQVQHLPPNCDAGQKSRCGK